MRRAFLLSPASCGGRRASTLLSPAAASPLAGMLRAASGAPLGQVFTYLSQLYFRGKLTYARTFAARAAGDGSPDPVLVITPCLGLLSPDVSVTLTTLREFAGVQVDPVNERYRQPLEHSARQLAASLASDGDVVLLGSIATQKYVEVLLEVFGPRLVFPATFVGRGDMSRGGLLLRAAADRRELEYTMVEGAVRHGTRPPRLPALRRSAAGRSFRRPA